MMYKSIEKIEKSVNSFDSLSPYIGKMRPELVDWIIDSFVDKNGLIYDPFSGSGTVLLEGWKYGHNVLGTDLNDYAIVLSKGKTNPYESLSTAIAKIELYEARVKRWLRRNSDANCPVWVNEFFHPDTLKEINAWTTILKHNKEWFLLSCLLGILHHQRPGFLSYPSSHGAPYLRENKFPKSEYPEMYQYREVFPRLKSKVIRAYKSYPELDHSIEREVYKKDASKIRLEENSVKTIITSPPYMKSLTYARDNRLRLWFLGEEDWKSLDKTISPEKDYFFDMMSQCFKKWYKAQPNGGQCIIVLGDIKTNYEGNNHSMPDIIIEKAKTYYKLVDSYVDPIPEARKVVKGKTRVKQESVLVFERR